MTRRHLNLTTKLASALLQVRDATGVPLIDWEDAKQMDANQIISLFNFDHYPIRHESGGPDEPWNLQPRLIIEHRIKTAKIDIPQIAKARRVTEAMENFRKAMLAKGSEETKPRKRRWPKRKMRTV